MIEKNKRDWINFKVMGSERVRLKKIFWVKRGVIQKDCLNFCVFGEKLKSEKLRFNLAFDFRIRQIERKFWI